MDMEDIIHETLINTFNKHTFKPLQLDIIKCNLTNENMFVLLNTGYGKSITFQLPAIICNGCYLIISPLNALIKDQNAALEKINIKTMMLCGKIDNRTQQIVDDPENSINEIVNVKIIYVTPEKLKRNEKVGEFIRFLNESNILKRIIIDECHVVVNWGETFRPAYISMFNHLLRDLHVMVPWTFYTATIHRLDVEFLKSNMINEFPFRQFDGLTCRPNLYLISLNANYLNDENSIRSAVMKMSTKCHLNNNEDLQNIVDSINNVEFVESNNNRFKIISTLLQIILQKKIGIIYCLHITECYDLAYFLKRCGIFNVSVYCSETPYAEKNEIIKFWQETESSFVIIATNAFGMGIDKDCVSFVIQYNLFGTVNEYVQQCGRTGRNDDKAFCLQLYSYNDYDRLKKSNKTNVKLQHMTKDQKIRQQRELFNNFQFISDNLFCKHVQSLRYFNNNIDYGDCVNSCCNCDKLNFADINDDTLQTVYISNYIRLIITAIIELQNVSGTKMVLVYNLNNILLGNLGDIDDFTNYLFKLTSFGCLIHTNQIIINNVYKHLVFLPLEALFGHIS